MFRSLFKIPRHPICTKNSVLPLNRDDTQRVPGVNSHLNTISARTSQRSASTSNTPESSLELQPDPNHTVVRIPEENLTQSNDPFIVPSRNQSGDAPISNETRTNEPESESESDANKNPSQYLQLYYELMYYTGLCTYKARRVGIKRSTWRVVTRNIQKVFFWCFAILSGFQSACLAKSSLIEVLDGGKYGSFVSLAHHCVWCLAKAYAVNLFAFKKSKTDKMLQEMEDYEGGIRDSKPTGCSRKRSLVMLLFAFTLSSAVARALVLYDDPKELIISSSNEFSQDIFVWRPNVTRLTNRLEMEYGKNITAITITFATIVLSRDAASYVVLGIIFDLVVIVILVVYVYVKNFIKEVKEVTANVPRENVLEWTQLQARREVVWRKYRKIRAVVGAVNGVFDPLLKLMHGGNLLMFAYFMVICVIVKSNWAYRLLYSTCMVKAEIGYYVAGWIAEGNDKIRAWLRNWALYTGKIKVGGEEMDINVVLDELDKEPIGLGKGKFLINHTLHFKFLGLVGSAFFSMADDEKEE